MLEFSRFFTTKEENVFNSVNWVTKDLKITSSEGKTLFKLSNAEFPDFYSDNAINIIASKYFIKNKEFSLKQLISRVVDTIVSWGIDQKYFSKAQSKIFSDELSFMMLHQMFAFNSPTYFNLGNPAVTQQVSACFILSSEDSIEGIAENMTNEMMIFKGGSGAGSNRSALRSSREFTSKGGNVSGPCNFMQIYDTIAKVIKSGGVTRRAAKMEILDADHGDIFQFIAQKAKEERKVKALIDAGWSSRYDDPDGAYDTAKFQSSNQTVSLSNKLMQCIEKNSEWALIARLPRVSYSEEVDFSFDNKKSTPQGTFYYIQNEDVWLLNKDDQLYPVLEWVEASKILESMSYNAWLSGDPAPQFIDTINYWHTCKADGPIRASNPCAEYVFLDDTSCNLGSFNLLKFFSPQNSTHLSLPLFEQAVRIATTAMDIVISKADYPTSKIANKTKLYRTIGLGYSNVGALLMQYGLPYDSIEGRNLIQSITAAMTTTSYHWSSVIAKELSPFPRYDDNKSFMLEVMYNHQKHIKHQLDIVEIEDNLPHRLLHLASNALDKAIENGVFRNAQVSVIAPTGTISFMMDCETTGCEPPISLISYKKLAGGGEMILSLPSVKTALKFLRYSNIDEIENYITKHNTIVGAPQVKAGDYPIFSTSIGKSNVISPIGHMEMMKAIQPFISGAISKTINLPNSATVQDIKHIYITAWKMGLKSLTIYRDGCKLSQPLSTESETNEKNLKGAIKSLSPTRKKLPAKRQGFTYKFHVGGHKGYLKVGLYPDGKLGEIFLDMGKEGGTIAGFANQWATVFSIALQYGIPLEELIKSGKNTRFDPSGITDNPDIRFATSIIDFIVKFLAKEFLDSPSEEMEVQDTKIELSPVSNVEYDGNICAVCGNMTVITGTCSCCPVCGNTSGCS